MLDVSRSRTADAVVDHPRGLTMGGWGMVLFLVAATTALAGLAAAGLYLHTGQPAWPPEPLERPGRGFAVVALALLAAAAVVGWLAGRAVRRGARQPAALAMLATLVLLGAAVVTLLRDLAAAGFAHDVHAYASVYWTNTASAAVFAGVAALMVAAVLVQHLVGLLDRGRMLEWSATQLYLWWTVGAVAVCLAVAHLLPDPAAGA